MTHEQMSDITQAALCGLLVTGKYEAEYELTLTVHRRPGTPVVVLTQGEGIVLRTEPLAGVMGAISSLLCHLQNQV